MDKEAGELKTTSFYEIKLRQIYKITIIMCNVPPSVLSATQISFMCVEQPRNSRPNFEMVKFL